MANDADNTLLGKEQPSVTVMSDHELTISLGAFPRWPAAAQRRIHRNEFHVLGDVRRRYGFEEELYASSGNVIFANYRAVRVFAHRMNSKRDLVRHPEQVVRVGQLNAMGLIDEIYHYILRLYEETANPSVFARAVRHLRDELSQEKLHQAALLFTRFYPPREVYAGTSTPETYLGASTGSKPNLEIALEEIVLLYFANYNPAFRPFRELFDDQDLGLGSAYGTLISTLERFFQREKAFGPDNQVIFDLLRAPILASPNSLEGQLAFIKQRWRMLLTGKFLDRILGAEDLVKEDAKLGFHGGPTTTVVPDYRRGSARALDLYELERYSSDLEWMPRVVLLAKNSHVWLDQLSKHYHRSITRLDQIPDEELDKLARWHFTGLWLIGIWERSPASQRIKQMTGNPEAVSSAYSVYEYDIAQELGGEEAFGNLAHRAWQRGIRLAGDMVPNHMGIYSRWVIEHPEYFIRLPYSPFPNYRFTGPDLSHDPSIQLRIEDGFWNRTDAAVVFQRIDNRTGAVDYIYHGNDGTNMPWNDTAQLNFLRSEVREAVIQTIFHVARKFSIIRFDAAMTLTKLHYQRLWYPQPGTGGDIPSRADHAMTKEQFDALFPMEFWREVVDRVNAEMPNTLLLAEAFWLLEGYFVRSLGMHRVYNSAFMHMLMKEENAKYRQLITNTLEYDPEILKRYVNFMSNPDEQTAVAQFGKDDKYFGVALMMVTLPGLPMFAHGQIEGYTEKYGMEYKRAYYDEQRDEWLVRRHEEEIFPIMNMRHLFSQVTHFELYDLHDRDGRVNENVFAYSNMADGERALVLYHNKYEECDGWILRSRPKLTPTADSGEKRLKTKNLGEALNLSARPGVFYAFRDHSSKLEYLREGKELHERGLFVQLKAFQYHVFLGFSEIVDQEGECWRLAEALQGRGVPDVRLALREMHLMPLHDALEALFSEDSVNSFYCWLEEDIDAVETKTMAPLFAQFDHAADQIAREIRTRVDRDTLTAELRSALHNLHRGWHKKPRGKRDPLPLKNDPVGPFLLYGWLFISRLESMFRVGEVGDSLWDRLLLHKPIGKAVARIVGDENDRDRVVRLLGIFCRYDDLLPLMERRGVFEMLRKLIDKNDVQQYCDVNIHQGIAYFRKEFYEDFVRRFIEIGFFKSLMHNKPARPDEVVALMREISGLPTASGYRLQEFQNLLETPDASGDLRRDKLKKPDVHS